MLLASVEGGRGEAGEAVAIGAGTLPGKPAVEPALAVAPLHGGTLATGGSAGGGSVEARSQQRRAIMLALVAAVGIGIMLIGFDATAKRDALWAMFGGRLSSAFCFAVFLVILRPRLRIPRATVAPIVAIGLLDTGANGLFALATTRGYLSLVAVLGSLYPVVTVVLAYLVLRERLARHQLVGVLAALAGVAVIAVH